MRYRFLINIMLANQLAAAAETFDLVTCMQTPVVVEEVVRVLRPGGIFITQQVGDHNAENLLAGWGWDSYAGWRHYFWQNQGYPEEWQDLQHLSERFQQLGCVVVRRMEYDVPYYFRDIRALVFWLEAIPPGDRFSPAEYERQIEEIVNAYTRPRGIETNEHRELLIVQKQGSSIGPTGKGQLRERDQRV